MRIQLPQQSRPRKIAVASMLLLALGLCGCGASVEILRRDAAGIAICNPPLSLTPEGVDGLAGEHCARFGKEAAWTGRKNNCGQTRTGMLSFYDCVPPRPLAERDRYPNTTASRAAPQASGSSQGRTGR